MPLTPFQRRIARLIAVNRSPSSHLAGAAAIHIGRGSPRTSNDLDYFHDEERLVAEAFAADRKILEAAGYPIEVTLSQPGFVRAIVGRDRNATKVEWAHDSAWRFLPPIKDPQVGYRLHPIDLSINKVLALAGRDEPRDFLDTIYVHGEYLSLGSLCWAAVGKDPGFSPELLVELLARKGRYRPEDFEPLQLAAKPDLADLKNIWIKAIADARRLIKVLPPEEAGCLYFDRGNGKFVTPSGDLSQLVRHRGSRGGILPAVGDTPMLVGDAKLRRLLAKSQPPPGPRIGSST
jgi:hypothetical protein